MDEGHIGHVCPHLKGSGDFAIHVRLAHTIRRVILNFVSQLFFRPNAPYLNESSTFKMFKDLICNIIHPCLE
jgi:hypothetical protein